MWDPRSYISQAVGLKNNIIRPSTLPSLYEYTTRFLFLEEEEKHLRDKMCRERIGWESLDFFFCDKVYTAHYCVECSTKEFVDDMVRLVKTIEEDVLMQEDTYTCFLKQVESLRKLSRSEEALCAFTNCVPEDKVYTREAYLSCELRARLRIPPSLSALLIERDSFHFLMKGETCTIPIAASIDIEGAPLRYESCVLKSDILCYTNGVCRSCRNVGEWCYVTLVAGSEVDCTAALLAVEAVCGDDVDSVLRTLAADGMIMCSSWVYSDGTVCQLEQSANSEDTSATRCSRKFDVALHRARVVRGSRNADAMHLLNDEKKNTVPREVTDFELALNKATLVATMQTVFDSFYFEVIHRVTPISDMNGTLFLSLEHDSPLHNNILKQGDKMLLFCFAGKDIWKSRPRREWIVAGKCDPLDTEAGRFYVPRCGLVSGALLFSSERSFSVGDSVAVIGTTREVYRNQQPVHAPAASFSSVFCYTPFVCKFLHRLHGPIGFVGYSFFFCSSCPLIATALLSLSLTDYIGKETDVDPAVVLFFFRSGEEIFREYTLPNFTDSLPFPLHHLTGERANVVSGTVTCRLLELGSAASRSTCYIMLSVTQVAFDGSEILQLSEGGH